MPDWIRHALTRKIVRKKLRGQPETYEITPRDELVYGVKFAMAMALCLSGIEIASMAFLHAWNSEVFSAITGLIGLVTGIFVGHRA
jgi:hypothetical protein